VDQQTPAAVCSAAATPNAAAGAVKGGLAQGTTRAVRPTRGIFKTASSALQPRDVSLSENPMGQLLIAEQHQSEYQYGLSAAPPSGLSSAA